MNYLFICLFYIYGYKYILGQPQHTWPACIPGAGWSFGNVRAWVGVGLSRMLSLAEAIDWKCCHKVVRKFARRKAGTGCPWNAIGSRNPAQTPSRFDALVISIISQCCPCRPCRPSFHSRSSWWVWTPSQLNSSLSRMAACCRKPRSNNFWSRRSNDVILRLLAMNMCAVADPATTVADAPNIA